MPWGVLRLVYRIERLHLYRLIRTHRKQKRRSPKPGEAGIVERRPCQHFLELPPGNMFASLYTQPCTYCSFRDPKLYIHLCGMPHG